MPTMRRIDFIAFEATFSKMKTPALFFALCFAATAALAETPTAEHLLTQSKTKAAKEQKAIFVHFGASWCGWCKRLDAFLERDDIKPVFEKYFVPLKLVVQENPQHKALENPGAEALLKEWGGPAGLPFSAFLDAQGKLVVNSMQPSGQGGGGGNIGYPSQPAEVDWFVQMVKKAAPKMSAEDLQTIEAALRHKGT
jgi:thiol-disulfide isomerase/thioredoxin